MIRLEEMSDKELIELFKGLHGAVFRTECYSASDVALLLAVLDELAKRGYTVVETEEVEVIKIDEEDE